MKSSESLAVQQTLSRLLLSFSLIAMDRCNQLPITKTQYVCVFYFQLILHVPINLSTRSDVSRIHTYRNNLSHLLAVLPKNGGGAIRAGANPDDHVVSAICFWVWGILSCATRLTTPTISPWLRPTLVASLLLGG